MSDCQKCNEPLVRTSWDIDTGDATWLCHNCRTEYRLDLNGILVPTRLPDSGEARQDAGRTAKLDATMCPQCEKPLVTRLSDGVYQCLGGCGYTATWIPPTAIHPEVAPTPALQDAPLEAREPHNGWLNAWIYNNTPHDQNVGYMWQEENLKMAGDWADFRIKHVCEGHDKEIARLKSCSTIEAMLENKNVDSHVREWETRCLKAEAQVDRLWEIVARLAEGPEPVDGEIGYCTICTENLYTSITDHDAACAYRMAVEITNEKKPDPRQPATQKVQP